MTRVLNAAEMKDGLGGSVNAAGSGSKESGKSGASKDKHTRDCWNCGCRHEYHKKEHCPAYGKTCMKCHKLNHFAAKCRGAGGASVKTVGDPDENIDVYQVSSDNLDESLC